MNIIEAIRANYEKTKFRMDVIRNPDDVVRYQEDLCRQLGRTRMMIEALPAEGKFAIIVHNTGMVDMLTRLMHNSIRRNAEFIVCKSQEDVHKMVRGFNGPVFIEHTCFYEWNLQFIKDCNTWNYKDDFWMAWYLTLLHNQQPLGEPFSTLLYNNLWELYN